MNTAVNRIGPQKTLAERYLAYRRTVCAKSTVALDGYTLKTWQCYLEREGITADEATRQHCEEYMGSLSLAPSTRSRILSQLRLFYEWMVDHRIAALNPWKGIGTPRQPSRVPRILTDEEYRRIDACLGGPTLRSLRDRSLIAFLYATACRSGEARGLDLKDLDLSRRQAIVLGKGNKERLVFFDEDTARKIAAWIKVRCMWAPRFTGPVWVGRHGQRMGKTAARDALIRAARDAGIPRHLWPHLLRHSTATHLLEGGMNIRQLQELLGHADLSSTQVYTHIQPNELRDAYDQATQGTLQHQHGGA